MRAFVRQAPGRLTRMHDRAFEPIPPEGAEVILDAAYQKALADGDIILVDQTSQAIVAEDEAVAPALEQPVNDVTKKGGR